MSAPVCDEVALAPARVRPLFTARIGFERLILRAIRANRRGFPNDSRYIRITLVAASLSQYSSRSLPEISALLPTDTNVERPRSSLPAASISAIPRPPLCDMNPIEPLGGAWLANV